MATYTNPVWAEDAPDPFVLSFGGRFWAYATETAKRGSGFQVLESPDLVNWTHRGLCFTPPWSKVHLWAPEVVERDDLLYMTYSALNPKTGRHDIGIATSAAPTGPFTHRAVLASGENNKVGVIDATIFLETDGAAFLVYSEEEPRRIVMKRLAPDWLSTVGEAVEILKPTEPWEKGVTEAPTLLYRGGVYHLFYSANGFETGKGDSGYCVAHAFSEKREGPYKKSGAILAQEPGRVYGPGHQCVVSVRSEDWLIYHGWSDQGEPRYGSNPVGRTIRLDRLLWQEGMPQPLAASTTPQPGPSIPATMRGISRATTDRAPAYPLICHDPYFSVWSFADTLTEDWPRHWTGAVNAMVGMVRIDGATYRWAGNAPQNIPALAQTGCKISPTRTIFAFEGAGVRLNVTFASPLLPDDLDVLSRPASYVSAEVLSTDGKTHDVSLYLDITGEWCVNDVAQPVIGKRKKLGNIDVLTLGTAEQPILGKTGDNLRIDWGFVQLSSEGAKMSLGADRTVRESFAHDGKLPSVDDTRFPRPASDDWPVLAASFEGIKTSAKPQTRRWTISYDDVFSLEYLGKRLRGWWRRNGADGDDLVRMAHRDAESLLARCTAFDKSVSAEWTALGGAGYARLLSLAWRQAVSAHKLAAGPDGAPYFLSKENFSNGCIATVDVTYPSAPLFLRYAPALLKAMIEPMLAYAETPRWKFPFAPHDLGTYPKANGQVYGGGERDERDQMPVEESGNLLLLAAALARAEGNVDFAKKHAVTLSKWAGYLKEKGLDPENQLCTDDFAGHLAHNANLSLKAILAIGAWGQLCGSLGRAAEGKACLDAAREMAGKWIGLASDGDHFKLAFDRPGTWSQKYNLVWDELLGLNLFPRAVAKTELAFYKRRMNRYGLPLDNRRAYTKLDWTLWTATLAESRADFDAIVSPLILWLDETPSRVPLTDWYETTDGKQTGFQARSVVGGLYLPVLKNHWKRGAR